MSDSGIDLLFAVIELVFEIGFAVADSSTTKKSSNITVDYNRYKPKPVKNSYYKDTELIQPKKHEVSNNDQAKDSIIVSKDDVTTTHMKKTAISSNNIKLQILMLTYIFKEDDGRISIRENNIIKKKFRNYKFKLNDEDINEIKGFENLDSSLLNIRSYIKAKHIDIKTIKSALNHVKDLVPNGDKYQTIYDFLRNNISKSVDY